MNSVKVERTNLQPANRLQTQSTLMLLLRVFVVILVIATVIPALNPSRVSGLISKTSAFLTMATSYKSLSSGFTRAINRGWVESSTLKLIYSTSLLGFLSILAAAGGWCMSFGKKRLQRLGTLVIIIACGVGVLSMLLLIPAYNTLASTTKPETIQPMLPLGFWAYLVLFMLCGILGFVNMKMIPKPLATDKYEMEGKYKLFLMILPFVILCFVFNYLPLWGWRYSFYDYKPGLELSRDNFVGFQWFTFLFRNAASRADLGRVMTNTLAMSGIGIATSFLPMAFAICLTEVKFGKLRKIIQTVTTVPNFISWVLVYSFVFALFATDGFVNSVMIDLGLVKTGTNYLMSGSHIWLKMWALGTWKGLGWGAIVYIAGISGIDQELYQAATVDGAGRFKRIWHITIPGLMPTFSVLLLLSIASILSNGMEQYYIFRNSSNQTSIEVLDLYVYLLGLGGGSGNIPLATVVGMMKSIISVSLLMGANRISKLLRGQSIV